MKNFPSILFSMASAFKSILFSMASAFKAILFSISFASSLENILSSSRWTRANRSYLGMLWTLDASFETGAAFGAASDDVAMTDGTIAEAFGEIIALKQYGPAAQMMPLMTAFRMFL